MKKTALIILVAVIVSLLNSCQKENMDTFGSYYVYMSKDTSSLVLKDTLYVSGKDTLAKDSAIKTLGVSRSGISPAYPALSVQMKIDSVYMDSLLTIYNNPLIPSTSKSDKVLYTKNAILLPSSCYSIVPNLTINQDERIGVIGLKLNLTKIAKIKTTKDFIFALTLVSCSNDTIKASKKSTILRLKRSFVYKTVSN
jgi:hypothetical protein